MKKLTMGVGDTAVVAMVVLRWQQKESNRYHHCQITGFVQNIQLATLSFGDM